MDLTKIKKLLAIVAESDVAEVEIEEEGLKVVVRKNTPQPAVAPPPAYPPYQLGYYMAPPSQQQPLHPGSMPEMNSAPVAPVEPFAAETPAPTNATAKEEASEGEIIRAPIVGTFYRSPSPDSDPFVSVGDRVQPGDVLCIIEAMKLMNEIECETTGVVKKILAQNAEPVEFDQPLFVIETL